LDAFLPSVKKSNTFEVSKMGCNISVAQNSSKLEQFENKWQDHEIRENIFNFNKFYDRFSG